MARLILLALSAAALAPAAAFLAPAPLSIRHAAGFLHPCVPARVANYATLGGLTVLGRSAAGVGAMGLRRAPVAAVAKRSCAAASLAPKMMAGSEVRLLLACSLDVWSFSQKDVSLRDGQAHVILNPTPYTLHYTPCTLYPALFTLHSTP